MELIYSFGCILICFANYNQDLNILLVGALCICPTGLERLHILTYVKRYLAVGHPITWLRNERGIRMRNISSDCAWLLSMFGAGLSMKEDIFFIVYFCLHIISIITISFCSLCVLCILIRPGPGEQGQGWPVKAEGILHYCGPAGCSGIEVCQDCDLGMCSIIQREIIVWLWNVFFLRVHFASSLV